MTYGYNRIYTFICISIRKCVCFSTCSMPPKYRSIASFFLDFQSNPAYRTSAFSSNHSSHFLRYVPPWTTVEASPTTHCPRIKMNV